MRIKVTCQIIMDKNNFKLVLKRAFNSRNSRQSRNCPISKYLRDLSQSWKTFSTILDMIFSGSPCILRGNWKGEWRFFYNFYSLISYFRKILHIVFSYLLKIFSSKFATNCKLSRLFVTYLGKRWTWNGSTEANDKSGEQRDEARTSNLRS